MLLVPEQRRSRRAPRRDPRPRCSRRRSAGGPRKRVEDRADSATRSFRRIRRRRRLPGEHRSERSEPLDTVSVVSGAIDTALAIQRRRPKAITATKPMKKITPSTVPSTPWPVAIR